ADRYAQGFNFVGLYFDSRQESLAVDPHRQVVVGHDGDTRAERGDDLGTDVDLWSERIGTVPFHRRIEGPFVASEDVEQGANMVECVEQIDVDGGVAGNVSGDPIVQLQILAVREAYQVHGEPVFLTGVGVGHRWCVQHRAMDKVVLRAGSDVNHA